MDVTMIGAYLGMVMIITVFGLEVSDRMSSKSAAYLLLMGIGQILLGVRAMMTEEWPFFALAMVWGAFAVLGLFRLYVHVHSHREEDHVE